MKYIPHVIALIIFSVFSVKTSYSQTKPEKCSTASYTTQGVFANSSGTAPVLKDADATIVSIGDKGELSKYFEETIFGFASTGWIDIGSVEVTSVKSGQVTFKVLEKKSVVTVNGKETSHFVAGKTIKFSKFNYNVPTKKYFYWADGIKVKAEGNYICDKKTGDWKYYFENGKLSGTETYDDKGILNGPYTDYYESGKLKEKGNEKDGKVDGAFELYYESGQLEKKAFFKDDKKHGIFLGFFANGNKYYETEFNESVRIGTYKEWYENGNLKEVGPYNNTGKKEGLWKYYAENGTIKREGNVTNDIPTGIWKYYSEDGILENQSTWENNQVTGPYKSFYKTGKVETEGMLVNDKEEGEWKIYFEDATVFKIANYKNGILVGPYTYFHSNGLLADQGTYNQNGNIEGDASFFYDNGKPKAKGKYLDGNKTGKWFEWDEKGKKKAVKY